MRTITVERSWLSRDFQTRSISSPVVSVSLRQCAVYPAASGSSRVVDRLWASSVIRRNRVSTWISRGERIIKSVTLIADKISRRSPGKKVIRSIVSLASLADRSAMLDARDAWILIGARDERKPRLLVRSLLANRVVYSTEIMVLLIEFE